MIRRLLMLLIVPCLSYTMESGPNAFGNPEPKKEEEIAEISIKNLNKDIFPQIAEYCDISSISSFLKKLLLKKKTYNNWIKKEFFNKYLEIYNNIEKNEKLISLYKFLNNESLKNNRFIIHLRELWNSHLDLMDDLKEPIYTYKYYANKYYANKYYVYTPIMSFNEKFFAYTEKPKSFSRGYKIYPCSKIVIYDLHNKSKKVFEVDTEEILDLEFNDNFLGCTRVNSENKMVYTVINLMNNEIVSHSFESLWKEIIPSLKTIYLKLKRSDLDKIFYVDTYLEKLIKSPEAIKRAQFLLLADLKKIAEQNKKLTLHTNDGYYIAYKLLPEDIRSALAHLVVIVTDENKNVSDLPEYNQNCVIQ